MRRCKCGVEHNRNHPYCSECQREYNRQWRAANRDKAQFWVSRWKKNHPERAAEINRKSDRKRYWENPEVARQKKLKQYYDNKEAWLARNKNRDHAKKYAMWRIKDLIRSGKLRRPDTCSPCGGPGPIEFHHPDYSQPEVVQPLCRKCHGATRRKEQTV